jgi:hypothetical protein
MTPEKTAVSLLTCKGSLVQVQVRPPNFPQLIHIYFDTTQWFERIRLELSRANLRAN